MTFVRVVFLAALALLGAACDLVVEAGQTTVLANRGTVVAVERLNAVTVRPEGTLIVADADVFGLGRRIEEPFPPLFPELGAAIVSDGGAVVIRNGTITGGNALVLDDPNTPTRTALGSVLAPALIARGSSVEISGGKLTSSAVFGAPDPYMSGTTVIVDDSELRITGGEFVGGRSRTRDPLPILLDVSRSQVTIAGGRFETGIVLLRASRTRIDGGHFGAGLPESPLSAGLEVGQRTLLVPPFAQPVPVPLPPGCTEIRGGSLGKVNVVGTGERLFLYARALDRPFGPLEVPSEPRLFRIFNLTGVLADGSPLNLALSAGDGALVTLQPVGAPGCD